MEEARADMPLAYIKLTHNELSPKYTEIIPRGDDGTYRSEIGLSKGTSVIGGKPEGVAVELIDGCIRILDYAGKLKSEFSEKDGETSRIEDLYSDNNVSKVPDKVPELIAYLHMNTSAALGRSFVIPDMLALMQAMALALSWVKKQGLDPLTILLEKHEFNKSRPYKHGKKF
ncbi:MAG: hypothetical protein IJ124_14345 [Clostridia bacterium]|nr:hypothetical protein [Clostridia bacterium]